jgi:hypothetical protein
MAEPSRKTKSNLDQRFINLVGRLPTSILVGSIAGAIVEYLIRMSSYGIGIDNIETALIFLDPYKGQITFYGALGGLAIGALSGAVTGRFESRLKRVLSGLIPGVVARSIAEIILRTVKEGNLEYALDFLWILREQIVLSGLIVGFIIGLLPLAESKSAVVDTKAG